jgi:hypothetical protein
MPDPLRADADDNEKREAELITQLIARLIELQQRVRDNGHTLDLLYEVARKYGPLL